MSVHAWWTPYITAQARARGLDPQAVLAVASREGLGGGVGDGGHAFGPFQLNDAGGVLTGRPGNHRAFAEGRAGINYALDSMAQVARGLKGEAAIRAIVTKFERPAAPEAEIAGALSAYGHGGGAPAPGSFTAPVKNGASVKMPSSLEQGIMPDAATTAADQAGQIRQQAMSSFSDIAAGGDAAQSFGDMAHFVSSMPHVVNAMKTTLPQIHPDTLAAAKAEPDGLHAQAVKLAQRYIGVKYTWGGTNAKTGFDCSGLVQAVWASLGVKIPRTTYAQWDAGRPVANNALRPGDEVFFTGSDPANGKPGHEGMYIGNGLFIEAPGSGKHVRVSRLAGRTDYVGARRFA